MHITAIVLAAGRATRMQADKLSFVYKGQPLLAWALAPLIATRRVDEVILVVNPDFQWPDDSPEVHQSCTVVVNPDYASGMSTSLRAGVEAAPPDTDAFLICLADMPEITAELIESLIDAFGRSDKGILVPVYDNRNGHPVLFDSRYEEELLQLQGDVGARSIVRRHAAMVEHFPTDDRAVVFDIDSPEPRTSVRADPRGS